MAPRDLDATADPGVGVERARYDHIHSTTGLALDTHTHDGSNAALVINGASLNNDVVAALTTEETWDAAVTVLANPGRAINVAVMLQGTCQNAVATSELGETKVEISLDGGSTWAGGAFQLSQVGTAAGSARRVPCNAHHFRTGTPTGNIQARVRIQQTGGTAGDIAWTSGRLIWVVVPA